MKRGPMNAEPYRPTRREERRAATVREIKALAMDQISAGGPDAVSLSGIVREMSMSPAAIYRYFENRDALLADLVVDAYDDFADWLVGIAARSDSATDHLRSVLTGVHSWATNHPNAYRLIFQTSFGSGQEFAAERTVPAASRSMAAVVAALTAASGASGGAAAAGPSPSDRSELGTEIRAWAERSGLADNSPGVLMLGIRSWTRLHGIISLELGGHLAATGIEANLLYETEVDEIVSAATFPGSRAVERTVQTAKSTVGRAR